MRILLCGTCREILDFFVKTLSAGSHLVDVENTFELAVSRFLKGEYDLVITEQVAGGENLNFCKILKLQRPSTNILVVSLFSQADSRKIAFQSGADGYVSYPCTEFEILEMVEKVTKRFPFRAEKALALGDLELYPSTYEAARAGKKISLRKKEYQLLEFLIRNNNRVINRHTILEYIWNYDTSAITNTLDVHIASLRKKIDRGYPLKMIRTVYGAGYKLSDR